MSSRVSQNSSLHSAIRLWLGPTAVLHYLHVLESVVRTWHVDYFAEWWSNARRVGRGLVARTSSSGTSGLQHKISLTPGLKVCVIMWRNCVMTRGWVFLHCVVPVCLLLPGKEPLCCIPLDQILAVERLQEDSFKMKNMFQIVQPERALYIQVCK